MHVLQPACMIGGLTACLPAVRPLQALRLVRQLLQHPPADHQQEAYAGIARLTIQAAYAAVAVSEQAVFAALDAVSSVQNQGGARGGRRRRVAPPLLHLPAALCGHPAAHVRCPLPAPLVPGLEQEAVVLYCELISHRGSWQINAAGCRALAESSASAAAALLSSSAPAALQR